MICDYIELNCMGVRYMAAAFEKLLHIIGQRLLAGELLQMVFLYGIINKI